MFHYLYILLGFHMSDFLNAFEAFLAKPGGTESPDPQAHSPLASKPILKGGVVVSAPSPEAEIPSTPLRKSTRRRRKKKLDSESSQSSENESVSW